MKTIIFDLDGTLLNTIDDLGYACNYALEKSGYPTFPIADYPAKVGNGINTSAFYSLLMGLCSERATRNCRN